MKLLSKLIFAYITNLLSLFLASYLVKGFLVDLSLKNFLIVGLIFTVINLLIRPIFKFILSPIIILTLGLGIIIVNALMLYLLDYFSKSVTIVDIASLAYAALIVSAVNIVMHFISKAK